MNVNWLDPNNSVVSTDNRSDRNIKSAEAKLFENINTLKVLMTTILQRTKQLLPKLATRKSSWLQIVKFTLNLFEKCIKNFARKLH